MKDTHVIIKAKEGYFLMSKDGNLYGTEICLGVNDSADNYIEKPLSEMPEPELTEEERAERELFKKLLEKYGEQ